MKFVTSIVIAALTLLVSITAHANTPLLPQSMYAPGTISELNFEQCTSGGESVYSIQVGSSKPYFNEYYRFKGNGAPYNGGYVSVSESVTMSPTKVSVNVYHQNPSRTLYFLYDDGDTTSYTLQTQHYKDEPDEFGGSGRWTTNVGYNLTNFANFDHNNNCNGTGTTPVPAVPTITKSTILHYCANLAKVEFTKPATTTRIELTNTSGTQIYWAGSATEVTTDFPYRYIRARACNAGGCSGLSNTVSVGGYPSSQCQVPY